MREPWPTIPRWWRLENPPAVFVGRRREVAWLAAALERGPVTALAGPAGIGKTALAQAALAARRPLVGVTVPSAEPAEQTLVEVARTLGTILGHPLDLRRLQVSFDALIDATLELGERWGREIVVDGLATHEDVAERWLGELAAHATNVRFLVIGRAAPRASRLAGQTLALGPLDPVEARALAEAWAPHAATDLRLRAARASGGCPGRLHAALRGATGGAGVGVEATRLLELLAASGQALDASSLDAIASAAAREELLAAGLLRPVGDGYEPWHSAGVGPGSPAALEGAAVTLVLRGGVGATLAAIALLARAGSTDRVIALLEERGEALLRDGYAARLWAALGDLASDELEPWQLRCAAQLGNPTALARACEPGRDTPADRLAWASTLLARGRLADAAAVARPLAAEGGPDRVAAACVAAEALALANDLDAALEQLDAIDPPADEREVAALSIARTRWALERGSTSGRSLGGWLRTLARTDPREDTWRTLAEAFERRGELDAALETLDAMDARSGGLGARPELLASRMGLVIRTRVAVERGEPDLARQLLDLVRPYAREPSALSVPLSACDLRLRWLEGHAEGLDEQIATALARARDAITERRLVELRERVACARGLRPDGPARTLAGQVWHARWGGTPALAAATEDRRDEVWRPMALACAALAARRPAEALAAAQEAVAAADRWSLEELALEARAIHGEALALAGDVRELREAAEELDQRATRCRSARFRPYARFFAAVAAGRLDPATAEVLAGAMGAAPSVARWARVVLGGEAALDRADEVMMAALRSAGAVGRVVREGDDGPQWARGWGIDLGERAVWLPSGQRIALGGRPTQWRILETLAKSPELAADKETIVRCAWEVAEYHPGRHDGRLHVAIRKLRAVIEDAPSEPTRIVTTEAGYALGRPVRLVD